MHPRKKSGIQLRSQIVWSFHFWSRFNDQRHPWARQKKVVSYSFFLLLAPGFPKYQEVSSEGSPFPSTSKISILDFGPEAESLCVKMLKMLKLLKMLKPLFENSRVWRTKWVDRFSAFSAFSAFPRHGLLCEIMKIMKSMIFQHFQHFSGWSAGRCGENVNNLWFRCNGFLVLTKRF